MRSAAATTADLQFGPDGLIPVVIQDADTGAVLMMAFMNETAFQLTRTTLRTHFWSRSRAKLWKKGETSGHEQLVEEIYVNCELNSLLITVRQTGAACHEGYPTCYFRKIEPDGGFTVVRDRWFDPTDVYDPADGLSLEARTRRWYGAYEYLRDHDLTGDSSSSRRLRDDAEPLAPRIADELRELAGVLTGEHRHANRAADIQLEGSQCLYWIALLAVRARIPWDRLRPDRALATSENELAIASAAKMLKSEANGWMTSTVSETEVAARCHAAIALVAQACCSAHVPPVSLVRRDLAELEARTYLQAYFS